VRFTRVREKENASLVAQPLAAVVTATVDQGRVVQTRHVLGTVLGGDEADVAPRVMAQVLEVRVREGDAVRRGETVVQLDAREIEDAVAQAEADLQAAKEALAAAEIGFATQRDATARDHQLVEAKAISQEQWDRSNAAQAAAAAGLESARARVEVATKQVDQAHVRLSYCHVTAPLTGVVARRLVDPGDLAVPGRPLLEIVAQEDVKVRASLPSENLTDLAIGRAVVLTLDDRRLDATISRVFPALGPSHLATFEVDLESPPPSFVSGATVGVDVQLRSAEGLTVPVAALLEGDGATWVFRVASGTVEPVEITILDRSSTEAVVEGPLTAGDRVVVARPSRLMTLADGMKVQVVDSES